MAAAIAAKARKIGMFLRIKISLRFMATVTPFHLINRQFKGRIKKTLVVKTKF
jgi:hypothetical protein